MSNPIYPAEIIANFKASQEAKEDFLRPGDQSKMKNDSVLTQLQMYTPQGYVPMPTIICTSLINTNIKPAEKPWYSFQKDRQKNEAGRTTCDAYKILCDQAKVLAQKLGKPIQAGYTDKNPKNQQAISPVFRIKLYHSQTGDSGTLVRDGDKPYERYSIAFGQKYFKKLNLVKCAANFGIMTTKTGSFALLRAKMLTVWPNPNAPEDDLNADEDDLAVFDVPE